MSKRQLKDFISGFLDYTKNSESPVSFHLWAACSAVASALQRRVYFRWGHQTIYPNLYVVLVGPSGQSRKSEPINIARDLVERLQIPMIGEDNSMEAVIREMKLAVTNYTDKSTGRICFQSAVSCFLEELAVFTGQQNTQFLAYLTNWYDSRDKWKRTTKHQGTDEIVGMCFNMLAATAPDWLPYIFSREAIGGGFTSRCIFIVEERKSKLVANPNLIRPDKRLHGQLALDLEIINTLSGEMAFDESAVRLYEEWYESEEKRFERGEHPLKQEFLSGYFSRRATHVKKLGMIMSASRGNDMTVTAKDFKRALTMLEITEKKMPKIFSGIGKARYAEETELVLTYLARIGTASKSQLLRQFYRTLDDYGLDIVIKVLSSMKFIKVVIGGGETIYKYIGTEPDEKPSANVVRLVKGDD